MACRLIHTVGEGGTSHTRDSRHWPTHRARGPEGPLQPEDPPGLPVGKAGTGQTRTQTEVWGGALGAAMRWVQEVRHAPRGAGGSLTGLRGRPSVRTAGCTWGAWAGRKWLQKALVLLSVKNKVFSCVFKSQCPLLNIAAQKEAQDTQDQSAPRDKGGVWAPRRSTARGGCVPGGP